MNKLNLLDKIYFLDTDAKGNGNSIKGIILGISELGDIIVGKTDVKENERGQVPIPMSKREVYNNIQRFTVTVSGISYFATDCYKLHDVYIYSVLHFHFDDLPFIFTTKQMIIDDLSYN